MPVDDIITNYRMNRLSIHDNNENIVMDEQESEEYLWVPPGLDSQLVSKYKQTMLIILTGQIINSLKNIVSIFGMHCS